MSGLVSVCAAQIAPQLGDATSNARLVEAELEGAANEGATLTVFPEAALTGYVFDSFEEGLDFAVRTDGPEVSALAGAAERLATYAVVGAIERDGDALFNSAFLFGPEGLIGRYRKVHTLCLGADRFTRPGAEGFKVFPLPFGTIGLHICYDGTFPESARALRLEGAQLLILPTNWPRLDMKREMIRVRAYENRAFYLAVNRVGEERSVVFEGGSAAADPEGRVVLEAGDASGRFHCEIDLARVEQSREIVKPGDYELDLIDDRQPQLYGAITRERPTARPTGSQQSR